MATCKSFGAWLFCWAFGARWVGRSLSPIGSQAPVLPVGPTVALALLAVLVQGPAWAQELPAANAAAAPAPSGLAAVVAIESALESAIASAEKSVVAIARVKHGDREEAELGVIRSGPFGQLPSMATTAPQPGDVDFIPNDFGAGVVIDRKGLILTHYHVVGSDSDLYVTTPARKVYQARIKAADPRSDLAVLSIDADDLTPIKFGDGGALKKGQIVIALGNPYAIARDGQVSASWGIVSNLSRKAPPTAGDEGSRGAKTLHQFGTLIQTDAKLNLGASGGALINLKGEMVGLITATAAFAGYEQSAGYAVPVDDTFRRVIETLKQGREVEFGFLGISPTNLESSRLPPGKHGIRVQDVYFGTPAYRAELKSGDIITHVNGQAVYDTDGLMLQVGKSPVEATADLTVERDGRTFTKAVELAKYPSSSRKIVTTPSPAWRGLRVDFAMRADPSGMFRDFRDDRVLVTEVDSDSPAWNAGLRPNMAILRVGAVAVTTPKRFHAAVAGQNGPVTLTVDGHDSRTVTVAPGE